MKTQVFAIDPVSITVIALTADRLLHLPAELLRRDPHRDEPPVRADQERLGLAAHAVPGGRGQDGHAGDARALPPARVVEEPAPAVAVIHHALREDEPVP